MKRIGKIFFLAIPLAMGAFFLGPHTNRASCFKDGTVSNSIAQAKVKVVKLLLHSGKDDWTAINVSERELHRAINMLEVNGPAMTFEHPSTRYVTFRLSNCPAITASITIAVHCGDTPSLGWIARSCLGREN